MADVVLQWPDLSFSFVVALGQYVHLKQHWSLQKLKLVDKYLQSVRTLVQSGGTEHNLKSVCSRSVFTH